MYEFICYVIWGYPPPPPPVPGIVGWNEKKSAVFISFWDITILFMSCNGLAVFVGPILVHSDTTAYLKRDGGVVELQPPFPSEIVSVKWKKNAEFFCF